MTTAQETLDNAAGFVTGGYNRDDIVDAWYEIEPHIATIRKALKLLAAVESGELRIDLTDNPYCEGDKGFNACLDKIDELLQEG